MSLDGFIATTNDELDFLDPFSNTGEDYGYTQFTEQVDTYIVGRKTYDVVCGLMDGVFPPANQFDCYVLSKTRTGKENGITYYNGDVSDLINNLKAKPGKHIYCDGGGEIVRVLLENNLIDEFIISVIPIFLGNGKRLFTGANINPQPLKAHPPIAYKSGIVQLKYTRMGSGSE